MCCVAARRRRVILFSGKALTNSASARRGKENLVGKARKITATQLKGTVDHSGAVARHKGSLRSSGNKGKAQRITAHQGVMLHYCAAERRK